MIFDSSTGFSQKSANGRNLFDGKRSTVTDMPLNLNGGAWRSLVARFVRDEEVAGSNPVAPTIQDTGPWCNGSTEDSGSFSRGSSPCGPATFRSLRELRMAIRIDGT